MRHPPIQSPSREHSIQFMQLIIIPVRIRRAGDVPRRSLSARIIPYFFSARKTIALRQETAVDLEASFQAKTLTIGGEPGCVL